MRNPLSAVWCCLGVLSVWNGAWAGERPEPAAQLFRQEVVWRHGETNGLQGAAALVDCAEKQVRVFAGGSWQEWDGVQGRWSEMGKSWQAGSEGEFVVGDAGGRPVRVDVPWVEVKQVLRRGERVWVLTEGKLFLAEGGEVNLVAVPSAPPLAQVAVSPEGVLHLAGRDGLWKQQGSGWVPVGILDGGGRAWAVSDVQGVVFDSRGRLWFGIQAGVGCKADGGWEFYEGRDGLPVSDFRGLAAGPDGEVWFASGQGLVRWDQAGWHYRQGRRWLPGDAVRQVSVDGSGTAWVVTDGGLGAVGWREMTLAEKAEFFEGEIARYVKRTPYEYVAEAPLRVAGDRSTANPEDSDNDGLWTAMYGAGECFGYGATGDAGCLERARQAFDALRFLQKVTQGGEVNAAKGFVARTIRPVDWPDPNVGRAERDRESQKGDGLWKVIEPRWPRSADGKWYWKSDTSSDELDGHYFFYPLYYDLCAGDEAERERVREVVRDLTDHLLAHRYVLMDHDGLPTRWAVFGPESLNADPRWWAERGLNSLSMLSYLSVAAHVTGDEKYERASRELIDRHGYAQNLMYPKVQQGVGSGNQSDDEMAFMCYYSLLRYSRDEALKVQVRWSFLRYWANEWTEMNPFFNFAYAAHGLGQEAKNNWGTYAMDPWGDWFEDSIATLRGFPLDRLDWSSRNSHRLDIEFLRPPAMSDIYEAERGRGHRVGGKVLPVENRHFNHWNTDPFRLDYGGNGSVLGAGTVFLLPYYMGMYHGFVEKR
jgi:hypothetical protein